MKYLIVGGTGSLGGALIKQLTNARRAKITIFSRDEKKQSDLKRIYPQLNYILGDIRDEKSVDSATFGMDVVFHVAALKQIDVLESNSLESIKTNLLGTINVAEGCIKNNVRHCVFSDTDKSVEPINTYGFCKGLATRVLWDLNTKQDITRFSVFRWGNVLASRGSAIPYFIEAIKSGAPVTVTNENMDRFWIRVDDAATFMIDSFKHASLTHAMIPAMKGAKVLRIIEMISKVLNLTYNIKYVGLRPGEKISETIFSDNTHSLRSDNSPQYDDDELYELLEPIVSHYS